MHTHVSNQKTHQDHQDYRIDAVQIGWEGGSSEETAKRVQTYNVNSPISTNTTSNFLIEFSFL